MSRSIKTNDSPKIFTCNLNSWIMTPIHKEYWQCGFYYYDKILLIIISIVSMFCDSQSLLSQCSEISFNFEQGEPCQFQFTYDNSSECYIEIRLLLEEGTFLDWTINTSEGFLVQEISDSELWITSTDSFLPTGFHEPLLFTLPMDLITSIHVAYLNDCPPGVGCELFPAPVLESCSQACFASFNYQYTGCTSYAFSGIAAGTSPFSYSWDFGDLPSGVNNFSSLPTPSHQFTAGGPHTVTLTIIDFNGCVATYSAVVSVPVLPGVTITSTPGLNVCQGQTTTLTANGSPGSTYIWNNTLNTQSILVGAADTYCVTCTDANGCTSTACVTVVVNPLPIVDVGVDIEICLGQSAALFGSIGAGTSPFLYSWSPGGSNTNPNLVSPGTNTTYTLQVTDVNGCSGTDNIMVIVNPLPDVNAGTDQSICLGQSATLVAAGSNGLAPYNYVWTPGGNTGNSFVVNPASTSTYIVQITDANGCTSSDQIQLIVNPLPIVNAGVDQTICPGQAVSLNASANGGSIPYTYVWSPPVAILNPNTVLPTHTTIYTVTVYDTNGCENTDQATIVVEDCCLIKNYIQNGDFTQGTPLGYDQIWQANHWTGIWPAGPGTNRNADYWGPLPSPPAPVIAPCFGTIPTPASQGKYAGYVNVLSFIKQYRQGMMNELSTKIAPNSGCYIFSVKLACPCFANGAAPATRLAVYGVRDVALTTIIPPNNGPGSYIPSDLSLFYVPPISSTSGVKQLGLLVIPVKDCDDEFETFSFQFNSSILNGPIDRIFITRDEIAGGFEYFAVDDVCITPSECDDIKTCQCGSLLSAQLSIISTGFTTGLKCNPQLPYPPVPCITQGLNYLVTGNFTCFPHGCGNNTIQWRLNGPGGSVYTGTTNNPYPYFQINLPWNFVSLSGNYALTINRDCGQNKCSCTLKFAVSGCPCICDASFFSNVNQGFSDNTLGNSNGCTRILKPAALCTNDMVTWYTSFGSFGPSNGNIGQQITFPGPGSYQVCMFVQRKNGNGTVCASHEKCQTVNVACINDPNGHVYRSCDFNELINGDFRDSIPTSGLLGQGVQLFGWDLALNYGEGQLYVEDSTGADDVGHLIFLGGENHIAGVIQELSIEPRNYINLAYSIKNYLGSNLPVGTQIQFRLQTDIFPESPSQTVYQQVLDSTGGWNRVEVSIPFTPDTAFKYFVISVQNLDTSVRSVVGLDNLELCTSNFPTLIPNFLPVMANIKVYPNPNTGEFFVELPTPTDASISLQIIDLNGKIMYLRSADTSAAVQTINISNLPDGMYFIQIISKDSQLSTQKFVKI